MKRISAYFFSLFILSGICSTSAQDSISIRRSVKIGADIFGPAYYFTDRNIFAAEGFFSFDIDTARAVVVEAGYLDYKYSQYNYTYLNKGFFMRMGIDFNLLQPETSMGKYYAGIGLRYGISGFRSEVPSFKDDNYWGTVYGSVPPDTYLAHFVEASPGIRTELFRNFIIGWSVRLRILIWSGTGKDNKSIYIPGYGNGTRSFSPGINYYLIWNIPLRKPL